MEGDVHRHNPGHQLDDLSVRGAEEQAALAARFKSGSSLGIWLRSVRLTGPSRLAPPGREQGQRDGAVCQRVLTRLPCAEATGTRGTHVSLVNIYPSTSFEAASTTPITTQKTPENGAESGHSESILVQTLSGGLCPGLSLLAPVTRVSATPVLPTCCLVARGVT